MLYVFMVNTGSMLTLDMALTMESVQKLQDTLAIEYQLPVDKQVLLISGGQSLDPNIRVCSYSAGTDTNPIFLFSKGTIESAMPPVTSSMNPNREEKLRLQVEGLRNLPHSYSAVVARTQLALQFHDLAKENLRLCESLVHDQHLQQQGWMAVVANLEDITSAFEQRAGAFKQSMTEFLEERPQLASHLAEFAEVLLLLEKTPLLPCLLDEHSVANRELLVNGETLSLMQWISNQDQRSTLQQMSQQCSKSLDQFHQQVLDAMSEEITKTLDGVNNGSMKEVKGLGERLFGLEQLLTSAQKVLQEQAEMAQGMVQNQTRASNLNDASVLPDLCKSHQQQLSVMYKKHCQLAEIRRRCQVAKDELCHNLHVRLRWIMYVEQQISAVHSKMLVYHENLKRLRKRLEIVRQVYAAPKLYAAAVVEVCRRRNFASRFNSWAGRVSETSLANHQSEMSKRKDFAVSMERHFLSALFPGLLGESLPVFATTPPGDFDTRLPPITTGDVDALKTTLPELSHILSIPPEESVFEESKPPSRKLKPSLSDEQTQTSLNDQEPGSLRSQDSDITVLKVDPPDAGANPPGLPAADPQGEEGPPPARPGAALHRPDSFPGEVRLLSTEDARPESGPGPLLSPDSNHSSSLQPAESFVSAATTPVLPLSPLVMSARGETPFASLLAAPEGNFYSAVTSPLDDADSPSSLPVTENSLAMFAKEVGLLKGSLQDTEGRLEELHDQLLDAQTELERKEAELQSANADRALYRDKLSILQTGVHSVAQKIDSTVSKVKEDCSEMRKELINSQSALDQTLDTSMSQMEVFRRQIQSAEMEERAGAVQTATREAQAQWETACNRLKADLDKANGELVSAKTSLVETRGLLCAKENELRVLEETGCEALDSLRSQMEEKASAEMAVFKEQSQAAMQDLHAQVKEREDALRMMKEVTEEELSAVRQQLSSEKEESLAGLKRELGDKHAWEMAASQRQLQDTHLEELAEFKNTAELRVDAACADLRQSLAAAHEAETEELRGDLRRQQGERMRSLAAGVSVRIGELRESHERTRAELKRELASVGAGHVELAGSGHFRLAKMEESFITERLSASLAAEEAGRRALAGEAPAPSSGEKEPVAVMAERQQSFNEAVSRVAASKERTIEELRRTVSELRDRQSRNQDTIEKLLADKGDLDAELTKALRETRQSERKLQAAVQTKEAQVAELQLKLQAAESRNASPAQLLVSTERDTMMSTSATEGRLQALLRSKEQECSALKHQVMQLRVLSGSAASKAEKISMIDISVGDLVLIFFEEPRDNYVVFSIEPTLYFVHSESLSGLGLKHHGSGGPKRQWIIGRVTDKEYCQAKKANNRFKVAIGTKFYRVKARKYDMKEEQGGQ